MLPDAPSPLLQLLAVAEVVPGEVSALRAVERDDDAHEGPAMTVRPYRGGTPYPARM